MNVERYLTTRIHCAMYSNDLLRLLAGSRLVEPNTVSLVVGICRTKLIYS
jgi:hypothetical protein